MQSFKFICSDFLSPLLPLSPLTFSPVQYLCFSLPVCHFTSTFLHLTPPSLGKQTMMKTLNEMPSRWRQQNTTGLEGDPPNQTQYSREKEIDQVLRDGVLYGSLVYLLQMRSLSPPFHCGCVCACVFFYEFNKL